MSALALMQASFTSLNFSSSASFSNGEPIKPCSILPRTVVANNVGSCETSPGVSMETAEHTNLLTKPLEVERANVATVELDDTLDGIIKPFKKGNDRRLSASRSSNESSCLAGDELGSKTFENRDVWSRRVVEFDVLLSVVPKCTHLKRDVPEYLFRLVAGFEG